MSRDDLRRALAAERRANVALTARLHAKTAEVRELLAQLVEIGEALREAGIELKYAQQDATESPQGNNLG